MRSPGTYPRGSRKTFQGWEVSPEHHSKGEGWFRAKRPFLSNPVTDGGGAGHVPPPGRPEPEQQEPQVPRVDPVDREGGERPHGARVGGVGLFGHFLPFTGFEGVTGQGGTPAPVTEGSAGGAGSGWPCWVPAASVPGCTSARFATGGSFTRGWERGRRAPPLWNHDFPANRHSAGSPSGANASPRTLSAPRGGFESSVVAPLRRAPPRTRGSAPNPHNSDFL